jgi:predicted aspartyl protease
VKLGTDGAVAPIFPLTSLPAVITENDPSAVKRQKKAPVKNNIPVDGVRRSARIAAARSMAVADLDSTANHKEPAEQTRKLMLLAQACATEDVAEGDKDFEGKQGEEPRLRRQPERPRGEASRYAVGGTIIGRFYEYPRTIVALLELGYLKELEQGVFLRVSDPSQRKVHPDLNKLSQKLRATQRERSTFETLLDNCQLIAMGNDIFCDKIFHQKQLTSNKAQGETTKPERNVAIDNGEQFVRDAYLAIVETGPESKYDYPPMLKALTELGFLEEYDKGVFRCVRDPKLQRKAWSLGALAEQALKHGLEETFLNLLQQQRELFVCSEIDDYERYWDKVRESFAQSKFYDDSYRGAVDTSALSAASTTPKVTVSRASAARVKLCDVSGDGLSALQGRLPASYSCDRDLGTHKAPRIDNSDPYKVALSVNGRILQNIIVETGCEMVVVGRAAARQAGIRPSMMRSGAVALRCADERVTKAFDRTIDPIPFVFNPGTEDETIVMAQVVVTNSAADTMLLGMSVIGKINVHSSITSIGRHKFRDPHIWLVCLTLNLVERRGSRLEALPVKKCTADLLLSCQ